jgi:hypothetical protein
MKINFYNRSAAEQNKSFLVQQFFKNAAEGLGRVAPARRSANFEVRFCSKN